MYIAGGYVKKLSTRENLGIYLRLINRRNKFIDTFSISTVAP